ncbi:Mak10 subunit, NatC N-terminal acetyltransferase-domain-containing protein [Exophiala viscosa]|uniref:Mak10 subunit, NatC N-terminal acetyltransferase-domain-containing protein n=1 Tax=Exophiala viscosa TaxID=2486360 RepID=A0AAN6DZ68_9EURO|nr:Mak10 subunit, NatC N-terminal acetyltransferase-domain-containing protein [Exophiala viscosa]KAI1624288.1 Mak10 subunit, NatC N-terminal acetyltransferase-domain-containing protein [Exophiala viscosa]
MVQPRIIHPNIQVNDITRQFRTAASTLRPGKVVKDEHFTLFEAVSALEIGDPKMDSGSVAFDPDTEVEFDFTATISPEEIIWLMDELLCREVAWQMGYPLSQTLFTSVHLERLLWPEPKRLPNTRFDRNASAIVHKPSLLEDVFRPFCLGLVKCCDLVLAMITSQHYYEEEDFATQIFNRPLLHVFPVDDILAELRSAQVWLKQSDLPTNLKEALMIRVDVRYDSLKLLQRCAIGERPKPKHLDECIALLERIEATSSIGRPVTSEAFTLKIQRRLASSVPPRPMVVIERDKAFPFFRQLFIDTVTAFQVVDVSFSGDLLVAYQHFMAQATQPAVYVRALLQSFLFINNGVLGQFSIKDFVYQDMRMVVLPTGPLPHDNKTGEIFTDQQFQVSSQLDMFVDRYGESFINLFRTFCLNRCRVRRTMCHAAMDWDQIQAEAEDLDGLIQSAFNERAIPYPDGEDVTFSYSVSSWVYHYKLMQLRTIVEMGFELSIYAPHEFCDMYWYLTFLCSTHLSHLERISHFVSSRPALPGSQQEAVQKTLHCLYRQYTGLKATEALAKALHRVFVILQRHKLLSKSKPTYASDNLRYELRMRPFLHLSLPEPISLEAAQRVSSLEGLSDQMVLDQALQLNQMARKAWEEVLREPWNTQPLSQDVPQGRVRKMDHLSSDSVVARERTKDVRNMMKSCIGTGIAISTLSKALEKKEITGIKVEIPPVGDRDRWHISWPVPKIRS